METSVRFVFGRPELVFLTLLCAVLVGGHQNDRAVCTTESVIEGHPASVTCHFPEDVTVHKHYVNIFRYDFSGRSFVPELLLRCFWPHDTTHPNCSVAEGFDFDEGQLSNTVTLSTRAATKKHAGAYACDYGGAAPSEFNVCKLNVKRPTIECKTTTVPMGEAATVTCLFNTNVNETKEGFYIRRTPTDSDFGEESDVLTCNWVKQFKDGIFCHAKEGCTMNSTPIQDRVTVTIAAVDKKHTGEYFCDTVPHTRGVTVGHCYLQAQDKKPTLSPETTTGEPSSAPGVGSCRYHTLLYFLCTIVVTMKAWKGTGR
ncbi:uncharacterized protein [Littorina saxatilis]|uniref:Ig-like domain-containing protein n=1 Tax=Littorina saxatilis TaxID=31220 RepID=A0AAN9AMN1_9CAEN